MRYSFFFGAAALLVVCAACRKPATPGDPGSVFRPYRFDDAFPSAATVSVSQVSSSALMADPVVWENFFTARDITWRLMRGRIGSRGADLLLKGNGATPVILAPKEPLIEWNRYEAVQVRMAAEGGGQIKIRVGDREYRQTLGPPRQYNDYRFDLNIDEPGMRPLAIMPTGSTTDVVAIRQIRLVPRKAEFPLAAGRQFIGKGDQYRNTLYVRSPSKVAFEVPVPEHGRLHFGMGIVSANAPIEFRVRVDSRQVFSKMVSRAERWEDADVDLSEFAGRNLKLTFETAAASPGAVALWANPLITRRTRTSRPNVLVYMIDTLRADHTSLHGYARETTPYLKQLGAQALVFDDCQAQATWTKPSTASLLTSLYAYTHGIVQDYDTIPKGAATLAGQLRAAGYVTAAVVANPVAGMLSGLQRGFDYMSEWAAVQRFHKETEDGATDSAAVNKILFPWLDQHRDEPFFLYAHTMDPHAPYRPPAGFEEKFANPAETAEFSDACEKLAGTARYGGGITINRAGCARNGVDPDRFLRQAVERYDAEILHNDWNFQQLVGKLRELGILDNTLIVVVSDHGEEFWEHGWTAHGHSLYQELTNAVCLMWNPKLIPAPRRVAEPVQLIDVMPTVLDLLGLPIPDVVQGQSLAALAKGQPFQRRGPVMTSRFAHPEARQGALIPENRIDTVALLDAKWKLIYRQNGPRAGLRTTELYDRRTDRGETRNVAAEHPGEVDRLTTELGRWMEAQKPIRAALGRSATSKPDQKTIDKLRGLGYLGGKQ